MFPVHTWPILQSLALAVTSNHQIGGAAPKSCDQVPFVCADQITLCFEDADCISSMLCLAACGDDAECSYICGMEALDNQEFLDLTQCMANLGCLPEFPEDGTCVATAEDTDRSITTMEQIAGDWWVVKGQSCGQPGWEGGYDWYPCQHQRFIQLEEGNWINNITYCDGANSVCTTEILITIADTIILEPGVSQGDFPPGQAPLVPQVENWYWISMPDPDWAFVVYCGSNPALAYDGAIVLSRQLNMDNLTPEIEQELRVAIESVGLNFDLMCATDNTDCPE